MHKDDAVVAGHTCQLRCADGPTGPVYLARSSRSCLLTSFRLVANSGPDHIHSTQSVPRGGAWAAN